MSSARSKSRLAGAMKQKASIASDAEPVVEAVPESSVVTLVREPEVAPAEQVGAIVPAGPVESPTEDTVAFTRDEVEAAAGATPLAETPEEPVDPAPSIESPAEGAEAGAPPAVEPEPEDVPLQTAQVRAGVGQLDIGVRDMVHLRDIMRSGRDQRRYVEDLPRRSDKGTYMRLPVHLQDVLAEYCDRNTAPMADFIAAVLDSYFRDLGVLPPLGQGHRPNEKMLDKIRKESRTYDY